MNEIVKNLLVDIAVKFKSDSFNVAICCVIKGVKRWNAPSRIKVSKKKKKKKKRPVLAPLIHGIANVTKLIDKSGCGRFNTMWKLEIFLTKVITYVFVQGKWHMTWYLNKVSEWYNCRTGWSHPFIDIRIFMNFDLSYQVSGVDDFRNI